MDRALGSYLGLAVGDALGATVEFMTAGEIATQYRVHRQMVGGGWLRLKAGQVTDDTQMCLALGRAILVSRGWNLQAVANAYVDWMRSKPVDIGNTCRRGLRRFMQDGSLCGRQPCEEEGGNGAAMRNLPVALATLGDEAALVRRSIEQAHLTHWHPLSDAATVMLGRITQRLLLGGTKAEVRELADELVSEHRQFAFAPWPGRTSGYIVDTVQTVFDGFFSTADFESCLIRVVNRGGGCRHHRRTRRATRRRVLWGAGHTGSLDPAAGPPGQRGHPDAVGGSRATGADPRPTLSRRTRAPGVSASCPRLSHPREAPAGPARHAARRYSTGAIFHRGPSAHWTFRNSLCPSKSMGCDFPTAGCSRSSTRSTNRHCVARLSTTMSP